MNEENNQRKTLTYLQAKVKAESYCAYQERAQQEVRDKLYSWGLHQNETENIIAALIEENFLNEERFAKAYALGKFRMKGWGKIKIRQHLKAKKITEPLLKIALREIDPDEYEKKLTETIDKKTIHNTNKLSLNEKAKLIRFLQTKGFENDLIFDKTEKL
ncbi:regulatory protein RecX [Sphingobacterium sp. LRF_L2]|uniref:regulatory protein RecX n=1 Tax=Sphingobacterium sp. LRF_L2 TaxID=3369421 RepID=UPI003F61453B